MFIARRPVLAIRCCRHFTSSGTSCGRGVELVDCKRACDAATQPQCTSFTFTAGTGLCFLFANGGCATCATSTVFGTFFHTHVARMSFF